MWREEPDVHAAFSLMYIIFMKPLQMEKCHRDDERWDERMDRRCGRVKMHGIEVWVVIG